MVWLEPKGQFDAAIADAFFEDLEAELLAAWPREKVITPDVVRGDSSELRAAVRERGWPKLGASRGHVLFALLNDRGYREHYLRGRPNLEGRLLFVQSSQADPFGAVMAMDDPIRDGALIRAAVEANFLVRTRADSGTVEARSNDGRRLQAALESGAQMISTDFPARVEGFEYRVEMPGGRPSRCNPVNAPKACTAGAVEDPGLLR